LTPRCLLYTICPDRRLGSLDRWFAVEARCCPLPRDREAGEVIRALLLAVVLLVVVAGCSGTTDSPNLPARGARLAVPAGPSPQGTPAINSTGITPEEAARITPLAPAELVAVADGARIRLSWQSTREDVANYRCLRREAAATNWEQIGRVGPVAVTYVDAHPLDGIVIYGIQAVNAAGTASTITESQAITTTR
jgi:hypothetical protein